MITRALWEFLLFDLDPAFNEPLVNMGTFQIDLKCVIWKLNVPADLFDLSIADDDTTILNK